MSTVTITPCPRCNGLGRLVLLAKRCPECRGMGELVVGSRRLAAKVRRARKAENNPPTELRRHPDWVLGHRRATTTGRGRARRVAG